MRRRELMLLLGEGKNLKLPYSCCILNENERRRATVSTLCQASTSTLTRDFAADLLQVQQRPIDDAIGNCS